MSEGPVSNELCLAKARECRRLAREAGSERERIMLQHIAETWERAGGLVPGSSVDVTV
ncbi:MAG: hypothetical protein AB1490_01580 [Pseudomonadota bacterium]